MKRLLTAMGVLAVVCAFAADGLCGRGGGGRGGGGGGRGGGGGYSGGGGAAVANRGGGLGAGPSAAPRPAGGASAAPRPATGPGGGGPGVGSPGVGTRPPNVGGPGVGSGPGVGKGPGVGSGPGVGKGPAPGGAGPSRDQLGNFLDIGGGPGGGVGSGPSAVNDFFQTGPGSPGNASQRPGPGAGGPSVGKGSGVGSGPGVGKGAGQVAGNRAAAGQNRPNRVENRQQLAQTRQDRNQEIQNEFRDNHPRFDFAVDHPRWANWRVNAPYRWATAALVTGWCGYGAASYYDYGENIYYQDSGVYADGQQIATTEQYAAAAEQIATVIPPPLKDPEWMPLGVFAVTQDAQASGPAPTMYLQLTISKEGIIAGTLQNTSLGTSQPIEGGVDKKSQRAAWVVSGKKRPLMETGIFNLTKDTAPALVHFEDGQTQQWLLVRIEEPKQ